MIEVCDGCEILSEVTEDPDYPYFWYCADCYMEVMLQRFNEFLSFDGLNGITDSN